MSTAELNRIKLDLISWINKLSDERTIEFLQGLRQSESENDWWNDVPDRHKEIIQSGIAEADMGDILTSAEFWNKLGND